MLVLAKMRGTVILIILLSLSLPLMAAKRRFAQVISAHDGDTICVRDGAREIRIRLLGIDTPEIDQAPWGESARQALCKSLGAKHCNFKNTKITYEQDVIAKDKYKRDLAYVYNAKGEMVNQLLLKSGYAVLFILEPNSRYAVRLKDAEAYARKHNYGIWQTGKLGLKESPYEFRKRKSKAQRKRTPIKSPARTLGIT